MPVPQGAGIALLPARAPVPRGSAPVPV